MVLFKWWVFLVRPRWGFVALWTDIAQALTA